MSKITKAVIPCGGAGTRFLPITKSVPKEILPIIDLPVLSYIIEEAKESGITDVLLILGNGKEAIKHYFTKDERMEEFLLSQGKTELYRELKSITEGINIEFTYQPKPLGSGDAVMRARGFTGKEPFCLALGDDIVYGTPPAMGQLAEVYEKTGQTIVGVQTILTDDITKYGVARLFEGEKGSKGALSEAQNARLHKCIGFYEKPPIDKIPSRLACLGRYVLDGSIYEEIMVTKPGIGGELQLTDSLDAICRKGGAYAYEFTGKRYDMGSKLESVKAVIEFALRREELRTGLKEYLLELVKTL